MKNNPYNLIKAVKNALPAPHRLRNNSRNHNLPTPKNTDFSATTH